MFRRLRMTQEIISKAGDVRYIGASMLFGVVVVERVADEKVDG